MNNVDLKDTEKIFLLLFLLTKIRSQNEVALTLASSEIASTLLDGGHLALKH